MCLNAFGVPSSEIGQTPECGLWPQRKGIKNAEVAETQRSHFRKFGVPAAGVVFAAFVPMALVLLVADMSGLADLYAVGVVGAIATNLGASATNGKLPLAKWERGLMFGTFLLMLAIEITLFATKPNARVFAVTLLTFGLILRGLASERRGRRSN
jgi:hypothetical protein